MSYNPSFTRVPSTKVGVSVIALGLISAPNTLVIVGHMALATVTLTISGVPTSGTVVLEFGGNPTTALAFGATTATIQAAIRLVAGMAGVTVTGSFTGGSLVLTANDAFPVYTTGANSLETAGDAAVTLTPAVTIAGGSAIPYKPYTVAAFGDPVGVVAEMTTQFGANSEIGAMVVAAINANFLQQNNESPNFPPIVVLPLANADTTIDPALTPNISMPMPYLVSPYDANVSAQLTALLAFVGTISSDDRGTMGQFGTFAFAGTQDSVGEAPGYGTGAASENLLIGWLRDSAGSTANTSGEIAAWLGAICAANAVPFNPLNDVGGGGLAAPVSSADWHTPGDAGTEELGLAAGLVPLMVWPDGSIHISRTVTTYNTSVETPSAAYYDYQDWAVLYYYRANAWTAAQNANFKNVKGTQAKMKALRSELIQLAKDFEALGMFQYVDSLVSQWTITIPPSNRFAAVYQCPVNVVPGFMNKGIGVQGTTEFDSFVIS